MINIKEIELQTFGNRRKKYYKELGYDLSGESFVIKIEDLNHGSSLIIPVTCDYCSTERSIKYKLYYNSILKNGKYACCIQCAYQKTKETNKERKI